MSGPDIELALMELYDISYKIKTLNEHSAKRPLFSVAFSEAEDINKYSVLESVMRNFIAKDVYAMTGLNLNEFLSLPHDVADLLMGVINDRQLEKVKQVKELQKEEEKINKELTGK